MSISIRFGYRRVRFNRNTALNIRKITLDKIKARNPYARMRMRVRI